MFGNFLLRVITVFSKNFHNSSKDQGHAGRSFGVGIYPKGGVELKELEKSCSKL
jgi:hypothetical protein